MSSSIPLVLNGHPQQAKYTKEAHSMGDCYSVIISEQTKAGKAASTDGIHVGFEDGRWRN